MKKTKLLISIAVVLIAVFAFGFTFNKPIESNQFGGYTVNVTVEDEGCPCGVCTQYVTIYLDGQAYDSQLYVSGTSTYTFSIPITEDYYSEICVKIVFENCSSSCEYYSTKDCISSLPNPPAVINLSISWGCE